MGTSRSLSLFSPCSLCALCFICFVIGCEPHEQPQTGPARVTTQPEPKPYVETVPGSTVKFTMRPVESMDGTNRTNVLWFAETETTWDAYDVFALRLDENSGDVAKAGAEGPDAITRPTQPYAPVDRGWGHAGYPVMSVTFNAAQKYCEWLTEKTGRRYRLPTTEEFKRAMWETCGTSLPPPREMYWFAENSDETTHPVATKRPNLRGLYDMGGNVAEWCTEPDGTPVVCGGSFRDTSADIDALINESMVLARPQTRDWTRGSPTYPPSKWWLANAPHVGFRVVSDGPAR